MDFNKLIRLVCSFFPSPLPIGVTEFNAWAGEVIALTPLPDNASMRFSLATMIMHAGPSDSNPPKRKYAKQLHKAAANMVASEMFRLIKEQQLAELNKPAVVTASQVEDAEPAVN